MSGSPPVCRGVFAIAGPHVREVGKYDPLWWILWRDYLKTVRKRPQLWVTLSKQPGGQGEGDIGTSEFG